MLDEEILEEPILISNVFYDTDIREALADMPVKRWSPF